MRETGANHSYLQHFYLISCDGDDGEDDFWTNPVFNKSELEKAVDPVSSELTVANNQKRLLVSAKEVSRSLSTICT